MGTSRFKMTSDVKDVERDLQRLQKEQAKLTEQLQRQARESKDAQRAKRQSMNVDQAVTSRATSAVTSLVGSYLSLQTVLGAVRSEQPGAS